MHLFAWCNGLSLIQESEDVRNVDGHATEVQGRVGQKYRQGTADYALLHCVLMFSLSLTGTTTTGDRGKAGGGGSAGERGGSPGSEGVISAAPKSEAGSGVAGTANVPSGDGKVPSCVLC